MPFAQKNYNEKLGFGNLRIQQSGCLLVAQSNLLERFGTNIDPVALNKLLKDRGAFLPDPEDHNVRQWLSWWTVTAADNTAVVVRTGTKTPPSDNCIVKLPYAGGGYHFCLVKSAANHTIIDSYDGNVKPWARYGQPVAWAEYRDDSPVAQPHVVAPIQSDPNYDGDMITVLPGWGLSHAAKKAGYADWDQEHRWAAIAGLNGSTNWKQFNDHLVAGSRIHVGKPISAPAPVATTPTPPANTVAITVQAGWGVSHVLRAAGYTKEQFSNEAEWDRLATLNGSATRLVLRPGQVVTVYRDPLPLTAPAPSPTPAPVVTAAPATPEPVAPIEPVAPVVAAEAAEQTAIVTDPTTTYETASAGLYTSNRIVTDVTDKVGDNPTLTMPVAINVHVAGSFTVNGERFFRTKKAEAKGWWYGVPADALTLQKLDHPINLEKEDDSPFDLDLAAEARTAIGHLTSRDRIVAILGSIDGFFAKIKNAVKGVK